MDAATLEFIASVLVYGCLSFLLTRHLCRYPARNFLTAKICFAFFFLSGLLGPIRSIQESGGPYLHDIEQISLAIGAVCGYWRGWKRRPLGEVDRTAPRL